MAGCSRKLALLMSSALREIAQQCEHSVENAAVAAADNVDLAGQIATPSGDEEFVRLKGLHRAFGVVLLHLLHRAEKDLVRTHFERRATGERKKSAAKLDGRGLFEETLSQAVHTGRYRKRLAHRAVLEPCLGGILGESSRWNRDNGQRTQSARDC